MAAATIFCCLLLLLGVATSDPSFAVKEFTAPNVLYSVDALDALKEVYAISDDPSQVAQYWSQVFKTKHSGSWNVVTGNSVTLYTVSAKVKIAIEVSGAATYSVDDNVTTTAAPSASETTTSDWIIFN
ncbi:uncharacterized protein LOC132699146 [Cylas formicarius]|uniref:uncharacterized protein LOC132699146 n=1 Tax=Cylas formicarius TaxID=197179 RepID=UPI0029587754|nr:uncharacterized protein LOC132699146 [Cylas formicarius]